MKNTDRLLWTCSKCGRRFANRNQEHSCVQVTVEAFLEGKSEHAVALFDRFCELVDACGPVLRAPAKTRVGFQVRMIFAAVNSLGSRSLTGHVVLARRLEDRRFFRIETISARNHVHHFRVGSTQELDDRVAEWLREAYDVGKQEHLKC